MNQHDAEKTVRQLVDTYLDLEDAILTPIDRTEGSPAAGLVLKQLAMVELLAVTAATTAHAAADGNVRDVLVGIIERAAPLAEALRREAQLVATPDWARPIRRKAEH